MRNHTGNPLFNLLYLNKKEKKTILKKYSRIVHDEVMEVI